MKNAHKWIKCEVCNKSFYLFDSYESLQKHFEDHKPLTNNIQNVRLEYSKSDIKNFEIPENGNEMTAMKPTEIVKIQYNGKGILEKKIYPHAGPSVIQNPAGKTLQTICCTL